MHSDLFAALGGRRYDLILCQSALRRCRGACSLSAGVCGRAGIAHAGGADGLDLVRRILAEAHDHLTPNGALVVEIGRGRDLLQSEFPNLPFLWLDTAESAGEVFALTRSDLDERG